MTTVTNNFEGGTNGATITSSNAGGTGNTQFNQVNLGSNGVVIFDNTHVAHGSLAMKLSAPDASGPGVFLTGPSGTTGYARFYFYATALPSTNTRIFEMLNAANNVVVATLYWRTDGKFNTTNKNNSGGTTTSVAAPLNQWVRVEVRVTLTTPGSGGACTHQLRLYNTADSTTASSDTQVTNQPVNATEVGTFQFGNYFDSKALGPVWYDDVGASDSAWLGPASSGPATITGASSPAATASISVSGRAIRKASASPSALASISASGRATRRASAAEAATSSISTAGRVVKLGAATLTGSSLSTGAGDVYTAGSATLAAASSIGSVMGHHTAIGGSTTNLAVATALLSGAKINRFAEAGFTALAEMDADATVPVYASAQLGAEASFLHFEYEIFLAVATVMVVDSNTAHAIPCIRQFGLLTPPGGDS